MRRVPSGSVKQVIFSNDLRGRSKRQKKKCGLRTLRSCFCHQIIGGTRSLLGVVFRFCSARIGSSRSATPLRVARPTPADGFGEREDNRRLIASYYSQLLLSMIELLIGVRTTEDNQPVTPPLYSLRLLLPRGRNYVCTTREFRR